MHQQTGSLLYLLDVLFSSERYDRYNDPKNTTVKPW